MELKINLNGIFSDPEGLTINEAIERTIIDESVQRVCNSVSKDIKDQLNKILSETIKSKVTEFLDNVMPTLMDYEFTETTSWGEKKSIYTVRNRILKALDENMQYKPTSYRSDRNKFTEVVDSLVEEKFNKMKNDFNKLVDQKFTNDCLTYAEKKLKERLNIQ